MAEKEVVKKWLALLSVLAVLGLTVGLFSLNVLYSISKSSNLVGELGELSASDSNYDSRGLKKDKCVIYCTGDCGVYWGTWHDTCAANCLTRYNSGELNAKQYKSCTNACMAARYSVSECSADCITRVGGDPNTGVCCYQDWITNTDGNFSCIYYY